MSEEVPQPAGRKCPLCSRSRPDVRWRKGDLKVVACPSCDLWYADPVPREMADGEHYRRIGSSYYLSSDKLESDYRPARYRRELRLFRRFCPAGSVLDVGCSTGAFLHRLQGLGAYRAAGTDVEGPALEHARARGIEAIGEPFLDHDFGDRRFAAVTFWAVLEHLADPLGFLSRAARLLEPGGHCFLLVPNRRGLATRILGERYRYVMPEHLNYFSRRSLLGFLERVPELQVVHLSTMMFNPVVILQDLLGRGRPVPLAERARLLRRTTSWKESRMLLPLRGIYRAAEGILALAGLADNLVAVARKAPR